VAAGEMTLADAIVVETMVFFSAHEEGERGELTLDRIDDRIDALAIVIQSLDVARSNPQSWSEHLVARTSSYEHLWAAEQVLLFLLANYAAYRAAIRKKIELPLISPQSLAMEVLALEWLPHEVTVGEGALAAFLAHPAAQVPRD
jgi:hypothetical protein